MYNLPDALDSLSGLNSLNSVMGYGIGAAVVMILAFIGAIVATVLLYIKFVGKNADTSSPISKFFCFDHLYIVKILEGIYLFLVVLTTIFCVVMPFVAAATPYTGGIGTFFASLLGSIINFFVVQFILRVSFEFTLLIVRISTDTHAIRNKYVGEEERAPETNTSWGFRNPTRQTPPQQPMNNGASWSTPPSTPYQTPNAAPTYSTPAAQSAPTAAQAPTAATTAPTSAVYGTPASTPAATTPVQTPATAAAPVQSATATAPQPTPHAETSARATSWNCTCGSTGNTGNFCAKCGKPRP